MELLEFMELVVWENLNCYRTFICLSFPTRTNKTKASKIPRSFLLINQEIMKQDFLPLENEGYIGHNVSKHKKII